MICARLLGDTSLWHTSNQLKPCHQKQNTDIQILVKHLENNAQHFRKQQVLIQFCWHKIAKSNSNYDSDFWQIQASPFPFLYAKLSQPSPWLGDWSTHLNLGKKTNMRSLKVQAVTSTSECLNRGHEFGPFVILNPDSNNSAKITHIHAILFSMEIQKIFDLC